MELYKRVEDLLLEIMPLYRYLRASVVVVII